MSWKTVIGGLLLAAAWVFILWFVYELITHITPDARDCLVTLGDPRYCKSTVSTTAPVQPAP